MVKMDFCHESNDGAQWKILSAKKSKLVVNRNPQPAITRNVLKDGTHGREKRLARKRDRNVIGPIAYAISGSELITN